MTGKGYRGGAAPLRLCRENQLLELGVTLRQRILEGEEQEGVYLELRVMEPLGLESPTGFMVTPTALLIFQTFILAQEGEEIHAMRMQALMVVE